MDDNHVDVSSLEMSNGPIIPSGDSKVGDACRRSSRERRLSTQFYGYIILAIKQNIKGGTKKGKAMLKLDDEGLGFSQNLRARK